MVHDLKPKKYKHQLFFLQNQKNHIFEVLAGIIPIKILWAILEKTHLPTDRLTVVKS